MVEDGERNGLCYGVEKCFIFRCIGQHLFK